VVDARDLALLTRDVRESPDVDESPCLASLRLTGASDPVESPESDVSPEPSPSSLVDVVAPPELRTTQLGLAGFDGESPAADEAPDPVAPELPVGESPDDESLDGKSLADELESGAA